MPLSKIAISFVSKSIRSKDPYEHNQTLPPVSLARITGNTNPSSWPTPRTPCARVVAVTSRLLVQHMKLPLEMTISCLGDKSIAIISPGKADPSATLPPFGPPLYFVRSRFCPCLPPPTRLFLYHPASKLTNQGLYESLALDVYPERDSLSLEILRHLLLSKSGRRPLIPCS